MDIEDEDEDEIVDQFRGWWVPVAVIQLYERRLLTAAEIFLLCYIDCLQVPEYGGCAVGPDELAKWWRKSRGKTVDAICKLEEFNLIRVKINKKGKYILVSLLQGEPR